MNNKRKNNNGASYRSVNFGRYNNLEKEFLKDDQERNNQLNLSFSFFEKQYEI
jgi:hypothetical protein